MHDLCDITWAAFEKEAWTKAYEKPELANIDRSWTNIDSVLKRIRRRD